jgi:hypothetical protein
MKWSTHEKLIAEIVENLQITPIGSSEWKITSHINKKNGNIELSEISHNEEDYIGIFDGNFYNDQSYKNWTSKIFVPEFEKKLSSKALEMITEEMREEMFMNWRDDLWCDETNKDNYEPKYKRNERLAQRLLKKLIHRNNKYVWDPGDIEGLIYYASGKYCLLETDIEQRVFDSQPRGYWIWKTPVGFAHGDYPDFCKNLKEFEEAVKTAPADLKTVREKTIDKAVEIVAELNRGDKAIRLNDIVFPQKGLENVIRDGFLARAKEMIINATREQLETAFDECMEASYSYVPDSHIVEDMLMRIGNSAPNPENEIKIDHIQFTDVRR